MQILKAVVLSSLLIGVLSASGCASAPNKDAAPMDHSKMDHGSKPHH